MKIRALCHSFSVMLKSGLVPSKISVWPKMKSRLLINMLKRPQAKTAVSSLDLSEVYLAKSKSSNARLADCRMFTLDSAEQIELQNSIKTMQGLKTFTPPQDGPELFLNSFDLRSVEILHVTDRFPSLKACPNLKTLLLKFTDIRFLDLQFVNKLTTVKELVLNVEAFDYTKFEGNELKFDPLKTLIPKLQVFSMKLQEMGYNYDIETSVLLHL